MGLVSYHCSTMRWGKLVGIRPKRLPVWAALCTGRADGSNPKYLAHVKHAILAMVRSPEPEAQSAVCALLQSNGWREPRDQEPETAGQAVPQRRSDYASLSRERNQKRGGNRGVFRSATSSLKPCSVQPGLLPKAPA